MVKKPAKILIADDDEEIRNMLRAMINESYRALTIVYEARDGIEASWKIQNDDINVLITDLKMPKKSGLDLVEGIINKKNRYPENIIILSGNIDEATIRRIPPSKRVKYLVKPFRMDSFMSLLDTFMKASLKEDYSG